MADDAPLVVRTELNRTALLKSPPMSSADSALVFLDKAGRLHDLGRPLTRGEMAWHTPKAVFEVDTAVRTTSFELELPAEEEAFTFTAKVVVHWRVTDVMTAVRCGLTNAELVIRSAVEKGLRRISRAHPIEHSAAAEAAIRAHLDRGPVKLEQGLSLVGGVVSLHLDDDTRRHIAARTSRERTREVIQGEHETAELRAKLDIKQEFSRQELEVQRAKFALQMADQEERHKLALEQMKMQFYSQALSEGNLNLIALRLSSNREDVNDVINLFMRQRQLDYEGARGMLNSLLDNRLVNKRDVADIMARATAVVADHMTSTPFGMPGVTGRQNPALNGGHEHPAEVTPGTAEKVQPARRPVEDEQDDELDDEYDDD
jgi:hypothetical protein